MTNEIDILSPNPLEEEISNSSGSEMCVWRYVISSNGTTTKGMIDSNRTEKVYCFKCDGRKESCKYEPVRYMSLK